MKMPGNVTEVHHAGDLTMYQSSIRKLHCKLRQKYFFASTCTCVPAMLQLQLSGCIKDFVTGVSCTARVR
jgi:hypothetical protein